MYVSQLRSVPVGRYDYYAYLVDASAAAADMSSLCQAGTVFPLQAQF